MLVVAADFFLMSNPLVFVAGMDRALTIAVMVTGSALVVTLPWVRAPRVSVPVLLFLGWLLLSYTWSIQPTFTVAAWAQTAAIAAVAMAVYANVGGRVLAAGFVLGGAVVSAASFYAFHELLPGAAFLTPEGYVMAGIGTNSNILAYTLVLSWCAACSALPRRTWTRVIWAGAIVILGCGLKEADSATGSLTAAFVAVLAVLLATYPAVRKRFLRTRLHVVAATVVVITVLSASYVTVRSLLGQDLITFSSRTPLWSAALEVAKAEPLQGFGYGAVWQHPWKPPLLNIVIGEIWDRSGLPLSHGHNSAVDLVVEVGVVGVLLMVLVMLVAAQRGFRLVASPASDRAVAGRFTSLSLAALLLVGVTEPMATIPLGWWVLVLLTEPPGPRPKTRHVECGLDS